MYICHTVSPSWPAVPFMGGVTSTSTLELFGRLFSVHKKTQLTNTTQDFKATLLLFQFHIVHPDFSC